MITPDSDSYDGRGRPCQQFNHISPPVIVAACLGASSAVLANTVPVVLIGKINERVPDNERISYLRWGTEVRRRFKELCPRSRLVVVLDSCVLGNDSLFRSPHQILGIRVMRWVCTLPKHPGFLLLVERRLLTPLYLQKMPRSGSDWMYSVGQSGCENGNPGQNTRCFWLKVEIPIDMVSVSATIRSVGSGAR